MLQSNGTGLAQITLNHTAPGVSNTTITTGPTNKVVRGGFTTGSCTTGNWVTNGTMFYLHNTPNGATPSAGNVIASFQATVLDTGTPSFVLTAWTRAVSIGTSWSTLRVQGANGFASPVALSYSGLPAGGTLSYLASPVTPSAESTFLMSTPITARWSYLVLQGQSGSVQHSDIVEIQNWPPQITSYSVSLWPRRSPGFSGTVTLTGGTAAPSGIVSFYRIDPAPDPGLASMVRHAPVHPDGSYTAALPPGTYRVCTQAWEVPGLNPCFWS